MTQAIIWSKTHCPFCVQAKNLLEQKNISYEEKVIGDDYTVEDLLAVVPDAKTVPQIFIGDEYIGGFAQLKEKFSV